MYLERLFASHTKHTLTYNMAVYLVTMNTEFSDVTALYLL